MSPFEPRGRPRTEPIVIGEALEDVVTNLGPVACESDMSGRDALDTRLHFRAPYHSYVPHSNDVTP